MDQLPRFDFILAMDSIAAAYGGYCAVVTFWQAQQDVTFPLFLKYGCVRVHCFRIETQSNDAVW